MKTYLARRLQTLAWLTLAVLLIGQLGALHWSAELFSHFVPHYAAVFALAALCLHNRWRYLWAAWALALTAWTLWPPVLEPPDSAATRLIWYNVNLDNRDARGESARLLAADADILALAEIQLHDPGWQPLRQHYPHGCVHEENSPFALAVFARAPLAACAVRFIEDYPYIRATLADGRTLYAAHPPPPINADLARARIAYLRHLADRLATEKSALLLGDLNSSPYSQHYRELLRRAGLHTTTRNGLPTWLPLGLNLDHALVRHGQAHSSALPWHTSDHRPLQTDWGRP
ncbi:endonuclease/exonuclease/phosphatase family protein [Cardiobacterium hominis]|uniref:endonuclease/exonuclease/phosphatase family protein n=1 Tax=Cardiobacterium hominis TaxID=2718 RepID=UPI0028D4633E|nr:endonuclease/exonuclease/phosphatase family protein [Cardiobacterium hominis]